MRRLLFDLAVAGLVSGIGLMCGGLVGWLAVDERPGEPVEVALAPAASFVRSPSDHQGRWVEAGAVGRRLIPGGELRWSQVAVADGPELSLLSTRGLNWSEWGEVAWEGDSGVVRYDDARGRTLRVEVRP